jgi:LCP family protein required for cell wall assembly
MFNSRGDRRAGKSRRFKIIFAIVVILLAIGGFFLWKTGKILNKISTNGNLLGTIGHMIPGVSNEINGEKDGRINILVLAMRGASDPNGGTLSDTSMIVSLNTKTNQISMISIPRDLYVKDIENDGSSKINAIYSQGLAKGGVKQAIADAEKKFSEVSGVPIHYTIVGNYQAFNDVVNAVGGVEITLDKPFEENAQFNQLGVCDGVVFTKPSGQFQNKAVTRVRNGVKVRIQIPKYPLCYNEHPECNGDFKLPAGKQTLDASTALCFARSRDNSSDFDRAKRQQMILQALKNKALSVGTLTDFNKINSMINALGNNFSTDLQGWEMKELYDVYMKIEKTNPKVIQRVLENTQEGLLYTPPENPETGYILLPMGDNYDKIHQLIQNTFTAPEQSDINVIQ